MSRGLGYVQRAVLAALVEYGYRSIPNLIRDVYDLHAHGSRIEPHAYLETQRFTVSRAVLRLEELRLIRRADRLDNCGDECWELAKHKPAESPSWRAAKARAHGPRLITP